MQNLTFDFTGQTVVVTGGARGIGLELGRFFTGAGADVYLMDYDKDEIGKAAAEVGARPLHADVSNTDDIDAAVEQIMAETGRIDVIVNNAGILRDKVLWKLTDDDWKQVLAIHAGGTFRLTRACDTTIESLATLPLAFVKDGTVTAGSASQISDGAAAVVVMSKAKAEELGLSWLAEIGAHGVVAGPDSTLQSQPSRAIEKACEREGIDPTDLDLVEINEAFAAVGIASARELSLDQSRINVNGGAIALGHPLGMSGARIVLHLALELRRRGGGTGAAALCGGGGQGDALILHVP